VTITLSGRDEMHETNENNQADTELWLTIEKGFLVSAGGMLFAQNEIVMPFLHDAASKLKALGFTGDDKAFDLPQDVFKGLHSSKDPQAFIEPITFLMGISIFLGTPIGVWAVNKVCDEVYNNAIRPAFQSAWASFFKRNKGGKKKQEQMLLVSPVRFTFGVWYDVDKIYIRVIAEIEKAEELEKIQPLVAEAHKAGLQWIETKGITHPILTYYIRHGQLSKFPYLSSVLTE